MKLSECNTTSVVHQRFVSSKGPSRGHGYVRFVTDAMSRLSLEASGAFSLRPHRSASFSTVSSLLYKHSLRHGFHYQHIFLEIPYHSHRSRWHSQATTNPIPTLTSTTTRPTATYREGHHPHPRHTTLSTRMIDIRKSSLGSKRRELHYRRRLSRSERDGLPWRHAPRSSADSGRSNRLAENERQK